MLLDVFGDQSAVTMLGRRFAAKQDRPAGEKARGDSLFDFSFGHQRQELSLVITPVALFLLVGVQHVLSGREQRLVNVIGAAEFTQKKFEIVPFGESRQLRDIVQSDINKSGDSVSSENSEEFAGGFLRKTDRIDFHSGSSSRSNSDR